MPIGISTGTRIQISKNTGVAGATHTMVTLPNVTSASLPSLSVAEIDITNIGSTTKSYICGTSDNGTCEFAFQHERTTAGAPAANIKALMLRVPAANTNPDRIEIAYNYDAIASGQQYVLAAFNAHFMTSTIEGSVDEVVGGTMTYRITGDVTLTAPTK